VAGEAPALDVAAIEAELDDVARALDRLDEGGYGTCEVCAASLADAELAQAPAARFCTGHQPGR
jgi:RNA polymerase-binding transcription factor DksA